MGPTPWKVYVNFKNLCLKVFYFCKILKMREKILNEIRKLKKKILYCTKPEFKVETEVEIVEVLLKGQIYLPPSSLPTLVL